MTIRSAVRPALFGQDKHTCLTVLRFVMGSMIPCDNIRRVTTQLLSPAEPVATCLVRQGPQPTKHERYHGFIIDAVLTSVRANHDDVTDSDIASAVTTIIVDLMSALVADGDKAEHVLAQFARMVEYAKTEVADAHR